MALEVAGSNPVARPTSKFQHLRMSELLDVVDEMDRVIGTIAREDLVHSDVIVRHVGVAVLRENDILLQLRSSRKQLYPGYWTLSATGHVEAGEDYEHAAIRELSEEVGIRAPVTFVSKRLLTYDGMRRMWAFFSCSSNEIPIPQRDEVEQVRYVTLDTRTPGILPTTIEKITPSLRYYLQTLK